MIRRLITRSTLALLLLVALYLAAVNTALNLPATRTLLNTLQPEQFQVTWRYAWSLYPLRLELTGVAADGQTPTEQWQIDARRLGVSVSLLPLLHGEVRVHDLDLEDIDLRLRPLPHPRHDIEHGRLTEFYPVIRNRDPKATAEPPPADTSGTLALEIDDLHIQGEHAFWVSHIRGRLPGTVRGSLRMETETGRLALAGGALDLALTSLTVGPTEPVTDAASIAGQIEVPPFTLSATEGLEFFRLPQLDAQIDLPVQNLDFLTLLMPPLAAMKLSGQGRLRGRLVLSAGEMLRGTDLVVEARALAMDLGRYDFSGDGSIELVVDPKDEAQADLVVRFDQVRAELEPDDPTHGGRPQELFTGRGLTAQLHAAEVDPATTSTAKHIAELASEVTLKLVMTIPSMQVADLSVYTHLFPQDWDLALLSGTGTLSGGLEVTAERLSLNLDLASIQAGLRYRDDHFNTDLLLQLRAQVDERSAATLHLDGTTLRLDQAGLVVANRQEPRTPWQAEFKVTGGALRLPVPARAGDPIPSVTQRLQKQGFGALLAGTDGRVSAVLKVSRLDWIAKLLGRPLDLSITGTGELDTEIVLAKGQPVQGTTLTVPRQPITLALSHHRLEGQGTARLYLEQGGRNPSGRSGFQPLHYRLAVGLDEARVTRHGEPAPSLDGVRLETEVLVTDPHAGGYPADMTLKLHSARIPNLSAYNAYLPANAPLSLLAGEASLLGNLRLRHDRTKGELRLKTDGLRVAMNGEELAGDLRAEVLNRDGSMRDLRFDISDSSLSLNGFKVTGQTAEVKAPDWHARLQLEQTKVEWHQPMHLDLKADITVKDTRPFLALLDNARGEHGWIDNLLTVENLAGHLRLTIDGNDAVIQDAMIGGPELTLHAKGRSATTTREAMLLVRWHELSGALELHNGQSHFGIGNAHDRFAAYTPGKTPLPFLQRATTDPVVTTGTAAPVGEPAQALSPSTQPQQPTTKGVSPAGRDRPDTPPSLFLDQ
jgi:hypothetical protein